MSQAVPERFRWLYDFDPTDRNALHARWHEDGVVNQAGDLPATTGRFEGYEGLDAMLAELESAATDLRFDPKRVIDLQEPDRHLVFIEFSARGIGSGMPIEGRIAHDVTLREGRIARMDVYATWEQALEAVGLSQ